jgi:3-methyl-2-oxobutanoate hydroxymethyltransferase
MTQTSKKVRVPDLAVMKERGEPIVMLTAYDATMARVLDRAGIDLLLVGDSLGNVILGLDTTIPVTLDAVIHPTRAVARGASRALVVADMPFLTYQVSVPGWV